MSRPIAALIIAAICLACGRAGLADEVKIFVIQPDKPTKGAPDESTASKEPPPKPSRDDAARPDGVRPTADEQARSSAQPSAYLASTGLYRLDKALAQLKLSVDQIKKLQPHLTEVHDQIRKETAEQREQYVRLQKELSEDRQRYQVLSPKIQELSQAIDKKKSKYVGPLSEKILAVLTDEQARIFRVSLDEILDSPAARARRYARGIIEQYAKVGLTDKQQERIVEIVVKRYREENLAALYEKASKAKAAGDEQAAQAASNELRKAQEDSAERLKQIRKEVEGLLSDEQKARLRESTGKANK